MRTTFSLPHVMSLALTFIAALCSAASAQTTPSSYFTVSKIPQIARQAITADFNGDGRLDLIANATIEGETPLLVLTLGRADGTFPTPQAVGVAGEPLAATDMNGDGRIDVVVRIGANYSVLPGNGNGTFGSPRLVHTAAAAGGFPIAVVGSFTAGDTIPDVVVRGTDAAGNGVLLLYPGNGNFTFGVPYPQPIEEGGIPQLRAVHLDNDGLSDLVGTNICCSVLMLRNTGTNAFELRTVPIASDIGEVHAADLNDDGVVDVVASQTLPEFYPFDPPPGIAVLWGGFSATTYETYDAGVRGEYALALADFTGDGQMDIASGNWSQYRDDDVGPQLWSSVSVLKGQVTNATTHSMTFEAPVTFPLGSVNGEGYTSSYSLSAGDFNGDGRLDLAHAPGAILLNLPPVPNRPPTVFVGADRTINQDSAQGFLVFAEASDPDGHWLTYSWNSSLKPSPVIQAYLGYDPGPVTLTVTVDDGHGGVASDSVTYTVADSYIQVVSLASPTVVQVGQPYTVRWSATDIEGTLHDFSLSYSTDGGRTFASIPDCINLPGSATSCTWRNPGPASTRALLRIEASYGDGKRWVELSPPFRLTTAAPPLPVGWRSRDIGAVGAAGSAVETSGGVLVSGSGADIWGSADELHFASTPTTGDFEFEARVQSVEAVNEWTKAGLMIRNGTGASAAHASIFLTPSTVKGLALQLRAQDGGASSERRRVTSVTAPAWLRLRREGTTVQASYRSGAGGWIDLPAVMVALGSTVEVGLAVSSHVDGTVAEAFFDQIAIHPADLPPNVNRADVGAVGAAGTSTYADGVYTIEGSGADIWGTADEFHWAYTTATGDFEFTGHVVSIEQLDAWVKAGLMIRESAAPGSRHVSIFATPTTAKGLAFQRRLSAGGLSTHTSGPRVAPPVWLRLTRSGSVIAASYRTANSGPWTFIGSETVSDLQQTLQVGLAVSSHRDGLLATAVFDHVALTASAFASADVGMVTQPGSTSVGSAGVTLEGTGADIWGTADAFRYYYRAWSGEGTFSTRVASLEQTNPWAKAGVMMRESRAAGSPHVMIVVSAARGVAMQYRATAGGASANVAVVPGAAPRWVRLGRLGSEFIGEVSADGVTWSEVGRVTVTMNESSLAGVVVTSHTTAALATATFDDIVIDGAQAP